MLRLGCRTLPLMLGAMVVAHAADAASIPAEATAAAEACQTSWHGEGRQVVEFTRPSEAVLCVRGMFQYRSIASIRAIPRPAAVKVLVINSPGGFTEPAIELAKLAEAHEWLIVVKDKCLSSCANYVFLARAKKVVLPQSVVGWHGLPMDPSEFDPDAYDKYRSKIPETVDAETALSLKSLDAETAFSFLVHSREFLAERKIPPDLCRKIPHYESATEYVARLKALANAGASPFWSYGRTVLGKKFNVQGIVYMWEPEAPEEGTRLALQRYNAQLFFFDLSNEHSE